MKNIYLLPTDKPSRLAILNSGKLNLGARFISSSNSKAQHIYITSNEEVRGGDYVIEDIGGTVYGPIDRESIIENPKKIILTDDTDLIKDGVQAIDDEFLEWFVKNSSCEEVEVLDYLDDDGNIAYGGNKRYQICHYLYDKIIIPQEESKEVLCGEADKFYRCMTCGASCGSEGHYIEVTEEPKEPYFFYEELKKHFENTSREKLLEEWEKSAESDKVGPTVEEFLNNSKQETVEEAAKNQWGNVHRTGVLGFIEGAKSDAAKDYWFKQFQGQFQSIVPFDAYNIEVFKIRNDENGKLFAYIGFRISNGNFHFNVVPFTEPQQETLEEATERILKENYAYKDDSGDRVYYDTQVKQCIIDGAKLKEERSYSDLTKLRNELYNQLPTDNIDAFELIKIIKTHIQKLDELCNKFKKK
jgi:hypothetical protein